MCDATLPSVHPSDYAHMPASIPSSDPLLNVGKSQLTTSLRLAHTFPFVADWLFTNSSSPFHPSTPSLPPSLLSNSLALHLLHEISTPSPNCSRSPPTLVTKTVDLLLIPVHHRHSLLLGYAFLNGLQSPLSPNPPPQFVHGRFAFDPTVNEFVMVLNSMSPHTTGLVSMRSLDHVSRERAFFAIPKATYGPTNLPSRAIAVQSHIDYMLPSPGSVGLTNGVEMGIEPILPRPEEEEEEKFVEEKMMEKEQKQNEMTSPGSSERTLLRGSLSPPSPIVKEGMNEMLTGYGESMEGLTMLLDELPKAAAYLDELDPLLEMLGGDVMDSPGVSMEFGDVRSGLESLVREKAFVVDSGQSLGSGDEDYGFNNGIEEKLPEWTKQEEMGEIGTELVVRNEERHENDAWNMRKLMESLKVIESTWNGRFYGPKVRKDILHPQTGELISRCTGELNADIHAVSQEESVNLRMLAAQMYFAASARMNSDGRLHGIMNGGIIVEKGRIEEEEGKERGMKRVRAMKLAPRPILVMRQGENEMMNNGNIGNIPMGMPHPEVVGLEMRKQKEDEEKEWKLEQKRIKNRLSAARSNQKRRKQLEAQKLELRQLRQRVGTLTERQKVMREENEMLRRQMATKT